VHHPAVTIKVFVIAKINIKLKIIPETNAINLGKTIMEVLVFKRLITVFIRLTKNIKSIFIPPVLL